MKNRIKHKIIKRKIDLILKEFGKHFTINKKSIAKNVSYGYGYFNFEILEEPNLRIGILNVTVEKDIKDTWCFMKPKYHFDKFHPCYCKDENESHCLRDFIIRVKQVVNDFPNAMKDDDETVNDFWETFNDAKDYFTNRFRYCGFEPEEYHNLTIKIKEFLRNVDYKKIPEILIRFDNDFYNSMGTIYFYPDWNKCDDKYLDSFEEEIRKLKLTSFQWRTPKLSMPKRKRKTLLVLTEGKTRTLFKYLKEKSAI